jgi:hypothetical protein
LGKVRYTSTQQSADKEGRGIPVSTISWQGRERYICTLQSADREGREIPVHYNQLAGKGEVYMYTTIRW